MTPRINPVVDPSVEQREGLAKTLHGPDGKPLNLFTTLAHLPQLMRRVNALGGYFMAHGSLPTRDREVVILRAAARVGSDYEIGQHRWIGRRAGLEGDEIEAALDPSKPYEWERRDRLLLAFTDELIDTGTVSDETWSSLDGELEPLTRLELLMMIGFYQMIGGVMNGIGLQLDESVAKDIER